MRLSGNQNRRSPQQGGRRPRRGKSGPCFVIQHHVSRSDYYDFRLEIDGVLVSWAIPRGASVNPQERRMARRTDDRPLNHAEDAEETISEDADGVVVLDQGTYANKTEHEMTTCLGRGHLFVRLNGEKLHGGYALTRIREGEDETWLLVKRRDDDAGNQMPVLTGRTLDDLGESP